MHILDVGCGPGTITVDLAALVREGQVSCFKGATEFLDLARAVAVDRGLKSILFQERDVHAIELPDKIFDIAMPITSCSTLCRSCSSASRDPSGCEVRRASCC